MSPQRVMDEPGVGYRRSSSSYDDGDHEISLGTPTILGLFFVLAVVCACFFGLGYALGRRTTTPQPASVFDTATATATSQPKPAAGSAAVSASDSASGTSAGDGGSTTVATTAPTASPAVTVSPSAPSAVPAHAPVVAAQPAATSTPAATGAAATYVVQVAAVSSQDVADILVSSLQKKGYAVAVRHEPQDKLLHVQIGSFSTRKDAEAMRQRVETDGFNAIVK